MEIPWNSLEVVKILISIITPIIGGIIAFRLTKIAKDLEKKQWADRKVIEKRLDFYDKVVPELNDLFCYYHRVGNWKDLTPKQIIEKKRFLDKEFNVYAHIFRNDILKMYHPFVDNCFEIFTGSGNDAKIKMELKKRDNLPNWDKSWNDLFIEEKIVPKKEFDKSYLNLLQLIKIELEI